MITISEYNTLYKDNFSIIKMKENSWGEGGDFRVWKNQEHGYIHTYINNSTREFEEVLDQNPTPDDWQLRILKQAARELLLMEGSDWPFLLYTEQAKEYANQRFHHHHQRFLKLLWAAKNFNEKNRINLYELEEIEAIDSCFRDINVDYFKKREV
jgi:1,4-alpha-glucan branching enzyme